LANESTLQATRQPGRPRSEKSRRAILAATRRLLEAGTVRDLSIEGIAREAGVGKTTIYRWWPNKAAVVIDAFFDGAAAAKAPAQAETAAETLALEAAGLVEALRGPSGRIVAEIVAEGQSDPSILETCRRTVLSDRRSAAKEVIVRGIAAGEFDSEIDVELALDMLYGPVYFRLMFGHAPLDGRFAQALPAMALKLLRKTPTTRLARLFGRR
jgi:AcrR family transcriptional regulator